MTTKTNIKQYWVKTKLTTHLGYRSECGRLATKEDHRWDIVESYTSTSILEKGHTSTFEDALISLEMSYEKLGYTDVEIVRVTKL